MSKKVYGFSIKPDVIQKIDDKLSFKGYRSRSHLVETLLEDWLNEDSNKN
jgi:metal-responsive CopG/Arc/MetJ family transcriptional regulator